MKSIRFFTIICICGILVWSCPSWAEDLQSESPSVNDSEEQPSGPEKSAEPEPEQPIDGTGEGDVAPEVESESTVDEESGGDTSGDESGDSEKENFAESQSSSIQESETNEEAVQQEAVSEPISEPAESTAVVIDETTPILYDDQATTEEVPVDNRPFGKGQMEIGAVLGAAGSSDYFSLTVGGSFAYFVVPRLAPGIDILYTATWGDLEYPQSMTLLPFVKFMILRSHRFSPYLLVGGGREFQWSGTDNPDKGYAAVHAWIFETGIGAFIGIGKRLGLQIQLLTRYYNFDETVIIVEEGDKPVDHKWYFPVINLGLSFYI